MTTTSTDKQGTQQQSSEVIHTNQKHPFLTEEQGFVPAGEIVAGMHLVRADGSVGLVSRWQVVPGVQVMYNLTVAQDHTFTVGVGQWVVHNCGGTTKLYRAIAEEELQDVLRFGDYGLSPSQGGKYFALTEQGARDFAKSLFNRGRRMTLTSIDIANSWIKKGEPFYDSGGARETLHFSDDILLDLYKDMNLPDIIEASWIPHIGK